MKMDLGKQIGPLPLGAWIAVVTGGLGLAYYGLRTQNTVPTIVDDTGGQPGVGDGSLSQWMPTSPPSTAPGGDDAVPTTNEAWAVRCINWLIAQGYDASESDSAIRKYIAGNDPSPSIKEYMLQTLALQHFGSPPQPLPPSQTPPPTIPPPPNTGGGNHHGGGGHHDGGSSKPPPTAGTWDTVEAWPLKKSTLFGMAEVHYGAGNKWAVIYNANRTGVTRPDGSKGMISNPDLIFAGWRLYIP